MITVLVNLIASVCRPQEQKELSNKINLKKRQKWTSGLCAPKLYPVEVYNGYFYTETNWQAIPAGGIINAGWGHNGMNMHRNSSIPDGFSITYFSYLENKFYQSKCELPKERISELFKQKLIGYRTNNSKAIIVGMAPGGVLVVWIKPRYNQIEIGRYHACEIDLDWQAFTPTVNLNTKDKYIAGVIARTPEAVANFKKNGLMLGLWDTYQIKYRWCPIFEFPLGSIVESIDLNMYNGEAFFLYGKKLLKNTYELRAIIRRVNLHWDDETCQGYAAYIDFDEAEIFEAYKQIYRNGKEQYAELVFKYNDNRSSLIILLRSKTEEIELRKCKIGIFKRTK